MSGNALPGLLCDTVALGEKVTDDLCLLGDDLRLLCRLPPELVVLRSKRTPLAVESTNHAAERVTFHFCAFAGSNLLVALGSESLNGVGVLPEENLEFLDLGRELTAFRSRQLELLELLELLGLLTVEGRSRRRV